MNPYRHLAVGGDPRTWHTPIIAQALAAANDAGIPADRMADVVSAKGTRLQLDIAVQVHPAGHREERKSSLTRNSRHRYHDDADRTASLAAQTREAIDRWAFNERRHAAIGDADCGLPGNLWAVHVPLVARRYAEWRGLAHGEFLHNTDEEETFEAFRNGDRVARFTCQLGPARIDATWDRNRVEVPMLIPHTLDAGIIGEPVSAIVAHPVLDHPLLTVTGLERRTASTVIELRRAWTSMGDIP